MTPLQICNEALRRMKQNPITAIPGPTETGSKNAVSCRDQFPVSLAKITSGYQWRWARKLVTLERSDSTVPMYLYYYTLPTDMERVNVVLDEEGAPIVGGYEIVGDKIYTDEEALVLNYGAVMSSATDVPQHIASAVTLQLADDLGPYLESDRTNDHIERLRLVLQQAKRQDAQMDRLHYGVADSGNSAIALYQ